MAIPSAAAAILRAAAAMSRFGFRGSARATVIFFKWRGREVKRSVEDAIHERIGIATRMVHGHIYRSLSIPVVRTGSRVIRSKPFEYPRLDTRKLRNDLFWEYENKFMAAIGTRIDYGLQLELKMSRSFLRRGLYEKLDDIERILVHGPPAIKEGDIKFGFRSSFHGKNKFNRKGS